MEALQAKSMMTSVQMFKIPGAEKLFTYQASIILNCVSHKVVIIISLALLIGS